MGRKAALILRVATMIAVGSVGLRAEIQAPEACAARQTLPAQVRPLTCRTAARMIVGMARSATLRRVIDRLGGVPSRSVAGGGVWCSGHSFTWAGWWAGIGGCR